MENCAVSPGMLWRRRLASSFSSFSVLLIDGNFSSVSKKYKGIDHGGANNKIHAWSTRNIGSPMNQLAIFQRMLGIDEEPVYNVRVFCLGPDYEGSSGNFNVPGYFITKSASLLHNINKCSRQFIIATEL
jgi:hypothetical protein